MPAYYNEIDPFAVEWLRRLMAKGLIADGEIDGRSITEVDPGDTVGFTQCHWFAGIGVWSYALRAAGWPDERPIWTASCPCQPFSTAGYGKGTDDPRHLWPVLSGHIRQCHPTTIIGEQVAGKAGLHWWDDVANNLESGDYACGAVTFSAAACGAPHKRQRIYWMAHARGERSPVVGILRPEGGTGGAEVDRGRKAGGLAHPTGSGRERQRDQSEHGESVPGCQEARPPAPGQDAGFWADCEWVGCTDGNWRPVEPGTFPMVDGSAPGVGHRTGRLKGYGNAIVAPQAKVFIETVMEVIGR